MLILTSLLISLKNLCVSVVKFSSKVFLTNVAFFILDFVPAERAKEMFFSFFERNARARGQAFGEKLLVCCQIVPAFQLLRAASKTINFLKTFHNVLRLILNGLISKKFDKIDF